MLRQYHSCDGWMKKSNKKVQKGWKFKLKKKCITINNDQFAIENVHKKYVYIYILPTIFNDLLYVAQAQALLICWNSTIAMMLG